MTELLLCVCLSTKTAVNKLQSSHWVNYHEFLGGKKFENLLQELPDKKGSRILFTCMAFSLV